MRANLNGANLDSANLRGADLSEAKLNLANGQAVRGPKKVESGSKSEGKNPSFPVLGGLHPRYKQAA